MKNLVAKNNFNRGGRHLGKKDRPRELQYDLLKEVEPNTRYQSNAEWPRDDVFLATSDNVSTDKHDSYDAAWYVCEGLKREGFGGERKIFPIRTWVSIVEKSI